MREVARVGRAVEVLSRRESDLVQSARQPAGIEMAFERLACWRSSDLRELALKLECLLTQFQK